MWKSERMVHRCLLTVGVFCLLLIWKSGNVNAASADHAIVVSYLENRALYRVDADAPWQEVQKGLILFPKNEIKTLSETLLQLTLDDGSEVRVAPNTHFRINNVSDTEEERFDIGLILGKVWAKFRKNVRLGAKLVLRTNHATIGVKGTSYEASATDSGTRVRVFTGKVDVSNATAQATQETAAVAPYEIAPPHEVSRAEWQVIVAAFYEVYVPAEQVPSQPQQFTLESVQNDWVDWNLEQDQQF